VLDFASFNPQMHLPRRRCSHRRLARAALTALVSAVAIFCSTAYPASVVPAALIMPFICQVG